MLESSLLLGPQEQNTESALVELRTAATFLRLERLSQMNASLAVDLGPLSEGHGREFAPIRQRALGSRQEVHLSQVRNWVSRSDKNRSSGQDETNIIGNCVLLASKTQLHNFWFRTEEEGLPPSSVASGSAQKENPSEQGLGWSVARIVSVRVMK